MKMTDLSPAASPELSPAAQAIADAAIEWEINPECYSREIAAAALRALAVRIKGADNIRQDVLDIAAELDGETTTSGKDFSND
jgi:hypothetical protein